MHDVPDLAALYALVPAAEEEDLLEEVAADRRLREWDRLVSHGDCLGCSLLVGEPSQVCSGLSWDEDRGAADAEDGPVEPPLTAAQVLGLVAHQLGGVVVSAETWGPRLPEADRTDGSAAS